MFPWSARWVSGGEVIPGSEVMPGGDSAGPSLPPHAAGSVEVGASMLIPGAGQWLGGRRVRAGLFLAAEFAGWWLLIDRRADGRSLRGAYRDLAWTAARFGTAARTDGPFDYYETMANWTRSGAFDRDATQPGVQPERDPTTWNGAQWRLAAGVHLGGDVAADVSAPGYERALAFYAERAWGAEFLWDWSRTPGAQAEYRSLIGRSDDAFRTARLAAGLLVANHLLAGAEAFLAARGARAGLGVGGAEGSVALTVSVAAPGGAW